MRILLPLLALLLLTTPLHAEDPGCRCMDLRVDCRVTPGTTVLVGDEFCIEVVVENVKDLAIENVVVRVQGCPQHARPVDGTPLTKTFRRIDAGAKVSMRACFVATKQGECRLVAHAISREGILTSAGCFCSTRIKGLPAIQLEMIDLDLERKPKGIFEKGEEFVYRCTVENDVGTTVTPDLMVKWDLPEHLEFVRGTGARGATVTGSGQSCESSTFVLAPPDGTQVFHIVVRAISVPERNLIQTRATVLSPGGQALALETESTTLKNTG